MSKIGCKDLKRYPHISRRVRDTLARLLRTVFITKLKHTFVKNGPESAFDLSINTYYNSKTLSGPFFLKSVFEFWRKRIILKSTKNEVKSIR